MAVHTGSYRRDAFFDKMRDEFLALTFDDVRLRTAHSDIVPAEVSLETRFSRNVSLKIPIVSAAMDSVTEARMAIALAKMGGLGIIHGALSKTDQAAEVARVKHHLHGLIEKPIVISPGESLGDVLARCDRKGYFFRTFPVVDEEGRLIGVLTQNDFDFNPDLETKVAAAMTRDLVTAAVGTPVDEAYQIMLMRRKKVLPIVRQDKLVGMYVLSDVARIRSGQQSAHNVDERGMLRVGAAVSPTESDFERIEALVASGVDVIVIDSARGDSDKTANLISRIKDAFGDRVDVVAGNISEADSAENFAKAGADGIKVGQGGGSICTTRINTGVGCPQVTAVAECERATRGYCLPICSDGGIRNPGDIPIAIGAGASSVMLGRVLAGASEAPGEIVDRGNARYKRYRGMGSKSAIQDSAAARGRYNVSDSDQWTPEGIESLVPYAGPLREVLSTYLGGLRQGMGYVGASTIPDLGQEASFWRITSVGLAESHPHDVLVDSVKR